MYGSHSGARNPLGRRGLRAISSLVVEDGKASSSSSHLDLAAQAPFRGLEPLDDRFRNSMAIADAAVSPGEQGKMALMCAYAS